jgi:hypothetical protein
MNLSDYTESIVLEWKREQHIVLRDEQLMCPPMAKCEESNGAFSGEKSTIFLFNY